MIITIDGPALSGKSTTAKMLAEKLDYKYLCTGAIYRTIAFIAVQEGIPIDIKYKDELLSICEQLRSWKFYMWIKNNELKVEYRDMNLTNLIKMDEISNKSSIVSSFPFVRESILKLQRDYAKHNSIVVEGRDVGSVIFPNADIKFYLTSTVEKRAIRQFEESDRGIVIYEDIKEKIIERDERDKNRKIAPLIIPENAIVIDNTDMTIDETFKTFLNHIEKMR